MKSRFEIFVRRQIPVVAIVCAFVGGGLIAYAAKEKTDNARATVTVQVDSSPLVRSGDTHVSFAPIVDEVAPSVVKIVVRQKAKEMNMSGGMSPFDDPMFRRFFGDRLPQGPNSGIRQQPQTGVGSGVVVSEDGYILTNNHVVDDADEVVVTFADGRELDATVVGKDEKTDLAVLKIEGNNFPAVTFADGDDVLVGDRVLAVGNPFGLGQTVTTGIVSGTGRQLSTGLAYENFIQTDAAINPGNSGGALVDMQGRLIGINTLIFSRSGGFQGIGFAIPVDLAQSVMNSLVQYGRVVRGFLGISIQNVSPELAEQFGLESDEGVLVGDVSDDGPAVDSGLEAGDVITRFNGQATPDARTLRFAVAETAPGTEVDMVVMRGDEEKTLTVQVGSMPGDEALGGNTPVESNDEGVLNGVGVADLNQAARSEFSIPREIQGALVTSVEPGSPAARAGLTVGDVIVEINREAVTNSTDAVELTRDFGDGKTLLRLWSRGSSHYLVVDESK